MQILDEKIVKLLMLTTSENDGEALSAIRKANLILKKTNRTWLELLVEEKADTEQPRRGYQNYSSNDWRLSKKGNYYKKFEDGTFVTVFATKTGSYSWVHDGKFCSLYFTSPDEAMEHFDAHGQE